MKECNVSNLTKALALVSLVAPATGLPLSIGDIELHSALNQALNAEIRLHVASGENPTDVSVRLAPPEKFDQAGIPWSYFLSKIKFDTIVQADGSIVVKLTSKETLSEPFLDFLLEVSWPQGNQYREFTVLIDPPAAYNPPAAPVVETGGLHAEPIAVAEPVVRKARPRPVRKAKPVELASDITPQTPSSGEYGPTHSADTLWRIAMQLGKEKGVPAQQMLIALYKANPEAFNHNDMDALKVGVTLRIPETEAILKPSQKSARMAEKSSSQSASAAAKALELVAPVESKIGEKAVVGEKAGEGSGSGTGAAAEGSDLELQARIDKLEQQLNMMQQLLALKDQQLAALQGEGKAVPGPQAVPVPEPQQAEPSVQAPTAEKAAETVPAETPPPVIQQPVPPKPAPVPKPVPVPVEPEPSFFDSDAYYITMGGLGAGILGVLAWLLWRRRKMEEQVNTESMFAAATEIRMPDSESTLSVPVMELGSSSAYDVGTVGESSFISEFTPSDFDAFDSEQGEVDPLSEADVYLAYGRYQQAEELIRHALADDPNRDDFKLKLLEIFYACENKEGFGAYAQELADSGKQNDRPFWNKVSDMAKEIAADLPLFGGAVAAEVQPFLAEEDVKPSEERSVEEQEQPSSQEGVNLAMEAEVTDEETLTSLDNSLDFDLGAFDDSVVKQESVTAESESAIESIDFDLSGFSHEEKPTAELELETFDFNFGDEETTETPPETQTATILKFEKKQDVESFDFSGFEVDESGSEPEIAVASDEPEISLEEADEFDFNFDFDKPIVGNQGEDEFDLGVSDLTDMDEFETKIDLAKAYMDMGDAEAAKSIAEEVLSKGSPEQKEAAQVLLDALK